MYLMPREQWIQFASTGTRTGKLAVVRAYGAPHVTPIWFLIDSTPEGDALIFTTHTTTIKANAFRRDPRYCSASPAILPRSRSSERCGCRVDCG